MSHPRCGTSVTRDIIRSYFKEKFDYVSPFPSEVLNQPAASARNDFYNMVKEDYYMIKYFSYMDEVMPFDELIDVIKQEQMTVYYLARKSLINIIISMANAYINIWDEMHDLPAAELNEIAMDLDVSDEIIIQVLKSVDKTYGFYKRLNELGLVKQKFVYEDINFDDPTEFVATLFGPNDITVSGMRTRLLQNDTRRKIIMNNNLDQRLGFHLVDFSNQRD